MVIMMQMDISAGVFQYTHALKRKETDPSLPRSPPPLCERTSHFIHSITGQPSRLPLTHFLHTFAASTKKRKKKQEEEEKRHYAILTSPTTRVSTRHNDVCRSLQPSKQIHRIPAQH